MHISELSDENFAQVIRFAPLVSIDIIIRNPRGAIMLGLRNNEPAKGYYFVPGGRIRKGETLHKAFRRILKSETGHYGRLEDQRFLGVYEHFYPNNRSGNADFGTHYVVLAYQLDWPSDTLAVRDEQHSKFEWMTPEYLVHSPRVHPHIKAYFA